ncbi:MULTISPECIES: NAD(P)H-dependent flavin oxidoreductase [unclassified Streptomyces]|uniref:NAD(P)H-dependent flavin oxidoreductase n=1 Tax=unclassified Streptomyces TaxID=2593676 RepID=UPI002258D417|nr:MULTISPECIES: nitronate monooxygenase [unclassified Streptomyces]MCX4628638.1 nitronate monooxygenase [Streptomyces sp. NBC_01443]WSW44659.1 nitronate monooxygenase [Streptomyces sp. NBC_01001]
MLTTPVCRLLGIDAPVVCAAFGPWEEVDLAAAVCRAGGLGSLGTAVRPLPDLKEQWARLRQLTDRPFAINHTTRPLNEEAFQATIEERPAAISFHLAVPPDLIARAHDAGILWIQLVTDLRQADEALRAGADVLVAQGGEAGGHGGDVGTMVMVPDVVDLADDVPVLAAGGIADGRGLAAALALGAQGVLMGTRFLASSEMNVSQAWKDRIVESAARDAVKVVNSERILPPFNRPGSSGVPRCLRTPLLDALREHPDQVDPEEIVPRVMAAIRAGGGEEYLPFTGQSAALVHEVLPAGEIVRRTVREAEAALAAAAHAIGR